MKRLPILLACLLCLVAPLQAQPAPAPAPPAGGLVFLDAKAPFTEAQKAALEHLFGLFPPRFRALRIYVSDVPAGEWRYGGWRGWTDESGNVNLKQTEWLGVRGLGLHELAHAYH